MNDAEPSHRNSREARWCLMIIIALSLMMLAHLVWRTPSFPYMPDSGAYVSEALRLAGAAPVVSEGSALELPLSARLFPVGFPALLALLFKFGVEPHVAAVAIAWISGMLIPFALYIPLSTTLGCRRAAAVAVLATLSPGIWIYAGFGLTDIFALLLSLITIGIAITARSYRAFFWVGVLAGVSYAFRNAQLALMMALLLSLSISVLTPLFMPRLARAGRDPIFDAAQRTENFRKLVAAGLGMAAIVVPLMARNIWIFGSTNPYDMPASTIGLVQNLRIFLHELTSEITANRALSTVFAWSKPGVLVIAALSILLVVLIVRRWPKSEHTEKKVFVFCALYVVIGVSITIAARTRYEWGDMINARHMLQYSPFVFAAAAAFMPRAAFSATRAHLIAKAVIVVLVGSHAWQAIGLDDQTLRIYERSELSANAREAGRHYLCGQDEKVVLMTNEAHVFNISCHRPGREPVRIRPNEGLTDDHARFMHIARQASRIAETDPVRIGIFPDHGQFQDTHFPPSETTIAELKDMNFKILLSDSTGFVFEKPVISPSAH
jgi:hypothetical protein